MYGLINRANKFVFKHLQEEAQRIILLLLYSDAFLQENRYLVSFIEELLPKISRKYRQFVFSTLNTDKNPEMTEYLNISTSSIKVKLMLFNTIDKTFHLIDLNNKLSLENFEKIIKDVINNKVNWSTGNYLDDVFLMVFGHRADNEMMLIIYIVMFLLVLSCLVFFLFYCAEKNESEIFLYNNTGEIVDEIDEEDNSEEITNQLLENRLRESYRSNFSLTSDITTERNINNLNNQRDSQYGTINLNNFPNERENNQIIEEESKSQIKAKLD